MGWGGGGLDPRIFFLVPVKEMLLLATLLISSLIQSLFLNRYKAW